MSRQSSGDGNCKERGRRVNHDNAGHDIDGLIVLQAELAHYYWLCSNLLGHRATRSRRQSLRFRTNFCCLKLREIVLGLRTSTIPPPSVCTVAGRLPLNNDSQQLTLTTVNGVHLQLV
ncbi:hypothetical protein M378DRAFT_170881 [Amanita muscaria Koide BX008]|uniref:Uncharacterized protein n=1 Tax=Amanita muscaria (strain Koide BX008) TaxID=946122 RepID=A0A0C2WAF3_AMAMK|nr:hypothetical protein M378DRAFT_170881 [Amanita muscaria Koide BX008]